MNKGVAALFPDANIELAARILREIQARLDNPTPAAIATLYQNLAADKVTGYGLTVVQYMEDRPWENDWLVRKFISEALNEASRCFPAHTRIRTSRTTSTAISALRVGDVVLAFDARAGKGRGALVTRRVTRLYRNTTTEWLRLRWFDGTAREVVTTPGHHFLDAFGNFPTTPGNDPRRPRHGRPRLGDVDASLPLGAPLSRGLA